MASTPVSEKRPNSPPPPSPPLSPPLPPPLPSPPASSSSSSSSSPTTADILTAAIYPVTLIAGSLFSHLSPSDASSTSYFSQKRNVFNVFFVKRGWLWTTFAFLFHVWNLQRSSRPRAVFRYGLATLWWVFVTQWFFGPPIMDRTFLFTGGTCAAANTSDLGVRENLVGALAAVVTSTACKVAGGVWSGGHDLSGHTFLLTHASMFLWSEVAPTVVAGRRRGWGRGTWSVLAVLGLWWWMLLMTGIYFHTWREKLTGWIVAMVEWTVVYIWALKTQPGLRAAIGVPGI